MGVLSNFFDGGQGAANKWNKGLMALANQKFELGQTELRKGGMRGRGDLLRALMSLTEGADAARGEIGRLGDSAKIDVTANQQQAGAGITQGLVNSGFSTSSVGSMARRGLASDTSRALGNIDSTLAQMYGDIEMQLGQGLAQGQTNLANLEMGTAGALNQSFQNQGMNYSNYFAQGGQSGLSMLADVAGIAAPFF